MTPPWTKCLEPVALSPTRPAAWVVHQQSPEAAAAISGLNPTAEELEDDVSRTPARRKARLERRLLLRVLAARWLAAPAAEVRVARSPAAGLEIVAPRRLYASVASRGAWTVVAVAAEPIGVDVEQVAPLVHRPLDLLNPQLAGALKCADSVAFAEAWTALEAFLKLTGAGLAGLSSVTLTRQDVLRASDGVSHADISHCRLGGHVFACANLVEGAVRAKWIRAGG